jgi:non-ribosomal peptide synthetase component E (peptide arylation enzyme)
MEYAATTINLSMIIEHHARQQPDKLAVVWNETRLTYKQLNDYANRVANGLRTLGIQAGDKVALSVFSGGVFRHFKSRRGGRAAQRLV